MHRDTELVVRFLSIDFLGSSAELVGKNNTKLQVRPG
jgi:hypothetical protein